MPTEQLTEDRILVALRQVPAEQWPEVLRYLESLQPGDADNREMQSIRTATDLAGSSLLGIWSDRNDLPPSQELARELRRSAERRQG